MKSGKEILIGLNNTPFCELSPTYRCTFTAEGQRWNNLLQYWVAMYFNDKDLQMVIRCQKSPLTALKIAKRLGFTDFSDVKPEYIIKGLEVMFNQNPYLKTILLSTGEANLRYIGSRGFLSENNRYGRLLMRLREMYMV